MDGDKELEPADDIEASSYFNLAVLNNGVTLKISEPLDVNGSDTPAKRSLFAVSNLFGLAVAGTSNGFAVYSLASLQQAYTNTKQRTQGTADPIRTVTIGDGGLTILKIGLSDKVVIAAGPGLQGGIAVWRLRSLVDGSSTNPLHVFSPSVASPLADLLPNPGDRPELLAALHQDGQVVMYNMEAKSTIATFGQTTTAACWSVRGKQIVCGDKAGNLTQYSPEGDAKTITAAPPSLREGNRKVLDIRWLENAIFFATYVDEENPMDTSIFICTRAKDGTVTYNQILDPLMVESMDRPEARYNAWLKNWAPFKHLLLVCNATSNTISHVGLAPAEENGGEAVWSCIKNDLYTTLPLETYPLGLEIDLTAIDAPPSEEGLGETALPMLWSYASDGTLSAWRIVNSKGDQYSAIEGPKDIVTQEETGASTSATASSEMTKASSPAATPAASTSPFGSSSGGSFGKPAFGAGSFSSPASFGKSSPFGQSPSFAPAFGQIGFGQSSGFGKSAFGQSSPSGIPAQPSSSSGSGFASFSAQSTGFNTPSASGNASPFGSGAATPSSTAPVFASSQPATFGTSTFGSSTFGSSTFGKSATPADTRSQSPAFGQTPAFGQSSGTSSPFGSSAKSTSPFGAFPSGKDDTSSAFGTKKEDKPSAFSFNTDQSTSKNAFGSSSTPSFTSLREEPAASTLPAPKPPGLDEAEAEDMEPKTTAPHKGGAFDFGDESKKDAKSPDGLSFGGLGFGPEKSSSINNGPTKSSPFGLNTTNSSAIAGTHSPEDKKTTAAPASSSPFGQSSQSTAFGKPAAFGQSTDFGQPSAFGQNASFGKPATFGSSTSSASEAPARAQSPFVATATPVFGQSPSFGKPQDKPSFSFGKTSSSPASGGFAGFATPSASTSASPFASKSPSPSPTASSPSATPAFGQAGFFKGFGQTPQSADSASTASKSADAAPVSAFASTSAFGAKSASRRAAKAEDKKDQEGEAIEDKTDGAAEKSDSVSDQGSGNASGADADVGGGPSGKQSAEWEDDDYEVYNEQEDRWSSGDDEQENEQDDEPEDDNEGVEDSLRDSDQEEQQSQREDDDEQGSEDEERSRSASPELSRPGSDASQSPPASPTPVSSNARKPTSTVPADSAPKQKGEAQELLDAKQDAHASVANKAAPPSTFSFGAPSSTTKAESAEASDGKTSPFSSFGNPSSSTTSDKPLTFAGWGASAASSSASPFAASQGKGADPPKPFGFTNLQKATPKTSSPLASMPAFMPPASPSQTQSSFDLSNLSSTVASPSTSPLKPKEPPVNDLGTTTPKGKPPPPDFFAGFGRKEESKVADLPAVTAKARSVQPSGPAPPSQPEEDFAPPRLSSLTSKTRAKPEVSKETLDIFNSMQEHIEALRESARECVDFYRRIQLARLPQELQDNVAEILRYEGHWGMGDLPRLLKATRSLSETLGKSTRAAKEEEAQAKGLEGSLLKTKSKAEEINRYLKAREDPQVAQMVRVRQLGPEQLENQARIRRQSQQVTDALDELESTMSALNDKVREHKLGRTPMQAPSLDSIHRAIRNLTSGLQRKVSELDDIALRLEMASLSTASPSRSAIEDLSSSLKTPTKGGKSAAAAVRTELGLAKRPQSRRAEVSARVERRVRQTLAAEEYGQKLKETWLSIHQQPLFAGSSTAARKQ